MRDRLKYFPVNWIDGMKINKDHFIAQDDATRDAIQDGISLGLSPIRFGILPASAAGEDTYNLKISLDNQNTLKVTMLACQAITSGGIRIALPAFSNTGQAESDGLPSITFQFSPKAGEASWWVVLMVHPFQRKPVGSPDLAENPPRHPFNISDYSIQVVSDSQFRQYEFNPFALTVGKVSVSANEVRVEEEYIPPCLSITAHPDLAALHGELDQFLGKLEIRCSQIVQKIFRKNQQNEISELVLFLCDRMILHLSHAMTDLRWLMIHKEPAVLLAQMASLARLMKNTIDMRIGSGKEEMINYLSEWCEMKQGELETMLSGMAAMQYEHNDINKNILRIVGFVKVIDRLFETLSKLEFIGKKKESGIFVKEEQNPDSDMHKARRRFFG